MKRPEQALQIATVRMIRLAYPELLFWHVGNGLGRSKVEGAILKAMGVLPGCPDLHFLLPDGRMAFIELKAGKGKATPSQNDFRDKAVSYGAAWVVATSTDAVMDALDAWLSPLGWRSRLIR